MKRSAALLTAVLLALAAPAGAQVYKWVDEKGRTHYGEKPPEGVKATEVGAPTPPNNPVAQEPDWKKKELEMKRERIQKEKKEANEAARQQRSSAQREGACADAHRRLETLEDTIRIYDRNAKGEKVYLEDKDRPAAIAKEKRWIADNCR